jgi:hypothetical protein
VVAAVAESEAAMSRPKRQSIRPTYDSRETGPAYHITVRIGDRTITFRERQSDPFVNTAVHLGWRTVLGEALRWHRLRVTFVVDGDLDRVDDVLELDADTLIANSTRRDAWDSHLNERLAAMPDVEE